MSRIYVSVEEAIPLPGLRLALTQGVPGPWGEAAKAIFDIKSIDYTPVLQVGGAANEELRAWTGQNSAPCAVFDDERPRSHWSEILLLAERLRPEPRLIPANEDERSAMFGIACEICGEDGFGWSARLLTFEVIESMGVPLDGMRRKFTSAASLEHASKRIGAVMDSLSRRLEKQRASGSSYLIGHTLSAADIYWTAFSTMMVPFDAVDCPMPDYYRAWCDGCAKLAGVQVPHNLIEHRQRILHASFKLPLWS
jgi:glutathione S-transferase